MARARRRVLRMAHRDVTHAPDLQHGGQQAWDYAGHEQLGNVLFGHDAVEGEHDGRRNQDP
jgi:hypothetical protein